MKQPTDSNEDQRRELGTETEDCESTNPAPNELRLRAQAQIRLLEILATAVVCDLSGETN